MHSRVSFLYLFRKYFLESDLNEDTSYILILGIDFNILIVLQHLILMLGNLLDN